MDWGYTPLLQNRSGRAPIYRFDAIIYLLLFGSALLLGYLAGYVSGAQDALKFVPGGYLDSDMELLDMRL